MKKLAILAASCLLPLCVYAQSGAVPARLVVTACERIKAGNPIDLDRGLCIFLIRGFMDGFLAGSDRGVMIALLHDSKAAETVQGVEDFRRRIFALRTRARCAPEIATISQVSEIFGNYIRRHPERAEHHFAAPMRDALEEYFSC